MAQMALSQKQRLVKIVSANAYDGGSGSMPQNQYDEMCNQIAELIIADGYRRGGA